MKERTLFSLLGASLLMLSTPTEAGTVKCSQGRCESHFYYETLKTREKKTLRFEIRNGQIDSTTVCSEHPYGSVIRRECRSAALELFKQLCAQDKARNNRRKLYCSAASRFSPIQ